MKKLLTILLLMISINIHAELVVNFDYTPVEQIKIDEVFSEEANIYLSVVAKLTSNNDWPGMKVILGYDFWCNGDNTAAKNIAQQSVSDSRLIGIKLEYKAARPNLWNDWEPGARTCTLTWKGAAHRTTISETVTYQSTISGTGSGIGFTFTPPQPTEPNHKSETAQKIFTMIKPDTTGEFCESL